ncbi:unnamed protein product [Effrenium voratum]|nr:unnamed protein product [Effrenium voratum]
MSMPMPDERWRTCLESSGPSTAISSVMSLESRWIAAVLGNKTPSQPRSKTQTRTTISTASKGASTSYSPIGLTTATPSSNLSSVTASDLTPLLPTHLSPRRRNARGEAPQMRQEAERPSALPEIYVTQSQAQSAALSSWQSRLKLRNKPKRDVSGFAETYRRSVGQHPYHSFPFSSGEWKY